MKVYGEHVAMIEKGKSISIEKVKFMKTEEGLPIL